MDINVINSEQLLAVVHKEERLDFRYRVWASLHNHPTEDIFGPTNEYLQTLPADKQDEMFEEFRRAHFLFSEGNDYNTLISELTTICDNIFSKLCCTDLTKWAKENANYYQDPKQNVSSKHSANMSYDQEEMLDLRILITAVKVVAPILGSLTLAVKDVITTEHKEHRSAPIVTNTCIIDWPPFQRFKVYIETYASRRKSLVPNSLRFGASVHNFDDWLIGLAVVRRFCIARLRSSNDGNIIAYIFNFLDEKIRALKSDNFRDKFNSGGSGSDPESEGYADQHRIPEDISEDDLVVINQTLGDVELVSRDLNFTDEDTTALYKYLEILSRRNAEYHIMPEVHYAMVIFTLSRISYCEVAEVLERDGFHVIIAATCVIFEKEGYHDLVELLLSRRHDKNPDVIDVGIGANEVINRLTVQLDKELKSCYPYNYEKHQRDNTNPGKLLIDTMVKTVNAYNWPDTTSLKTIRLNLAKYIISLVPEESRHYDK